MKKGKKCKCGGRFSVLMLGGFVVMCKGCKKVKARKG